MSPLLQASLPKKSAPHRFTTVVKLGDGKTTTLHLVRYNRESLKAKIVVFEQATRLIDWCIETGTTEAIVGGFFLRTSNEILGDTWTNGVKHDFVPITAPWQKVRGSIHITSEGELALGRRGFFPATPKNDLLQAGPMLVCKGESQIINGKEAEGISAACQQFDTDITIGRYPRAAIGLNQQHVWSLVCDGKTPQDAGVTLQELADIMVTLGAQEALNLDGGGSASQVSGGILRNHSRGDGQEYPRGRPISNAIVFERN